MFHRFLIVAAAFLLLLVFYFNPSGLRTLPSRITSVGNNLYSPASRWQFDFVRDANVHSLTRAQCEIAFPGLYDNVDASVKASEGKHIREEELEIRQGHCMLRILIHHGQMRVVDLGTPQDCVVSNGRERIIASLNLIQRAASAAPEAIPNIEFTLSYDDLPTRSTPNTTWGFTRKTDQPQVWLMPDYGYWSWWAVGISSFSTLWLKIEDIDRVTPWTSKIPKAVWRGATHSRPEVREKLITVAEGREWADVNAVTINRDEKHYLTLPDHCRYQYVVQTEGTSYSGRFKFLQLCNSVTVSHKLEYAEFATHLMRPNGSEQNFIEVDRDWSDLEAKMAYSLAHPEEAERIAARSHELFHRRYITPAAISCYLRRMFDRWSRMQGFEPKLYEDDEFGARKMRGLPFEAVAVSFPQGKPSLDEMCC